MPRTIEVTEEEFVLLEQAKAERERVAKERDEARAEYEKLKKENPLLAARYALTHYSRLYPGR